MADYIPNCENNVRFVCPYSPSCENNVRFPETTCETNVLLGESDGYADCVSVAELTTEHYNVLGNNDGYTDCVSDAELRTYPTIHLGINYGYTDCVSEAELRTYPTVYLGVCNNYTDCVSVAELKTEPYNVLGNNDGYTDCVSEAELKTNVYLEESNGYTGCVSEAELRTNVYLGINDGYIGCVSEAELRIYPTVYLGINDGYTGCVSEAELRIYPTVYLGVCNNYTDCVSVAELKANVYLEESDGYTDCVSVAELRTYPIVYLGVCNNYTDCVSEAELKANVYLGINDGYTDCVSESDLKIYPAVYLGVCNNYTDCVSEAELKANVYLGINNGYIGCVSVAELKANVYLDESDGYAGCVSATTILNISGVIALPIVRVLSGNDLTGELTPNENIGFTAALLYHSILLSSDLTPYNIPHFSGDLYDGLISSCNSFVYEDFIDGYIDIKIKCEQLFLTEDLLIRPSTTTLIFYTGLKLECELTTRPGEQFSCINYVGNISYCDTIEVITLFIPLSKVYLSNSQSIHAELRTLPQGFAFPYDSTTFFDLTSDRCCPVRRSSLSNQFYIELSDGPEPYEEYSGIRVFLQGVLHTEKRFTCNLYTGQYCFTDDYSDYLDVIIPNNLNLNFEFDSFYSVKLCYGNFIPNGDYIPIELGTTIIENCISYVLYSGYGFEAYLSKYFENTASVYNGQIMDGVLEPDVDLVVYLYTGLRLKIPEDARFSVDFYNGDYSHATLYDYPTDLYTGAVLEAPTIYIEYFVKFNERGLLNNELIFQNKDGDRVDLLFDESCTENEYYIHDIKAQCY